MLRSIIKQIEYYLPEKLLTNKQLAEEFPHWSMDKVAQKTGIDQRHVADNEYTSDIAIAAAKKLFDAKSCLPNDIDFLLLCTQCPDYLLPTTACIVQDRLGLSKTIGALDINLGCSGFVYSLSLAKALIETQQARNVLVITADTYTKLIHSEDRSVRTIFGDGAAATLLTSIEDSEQSQPLGIHQFVFGTDGSGANNFIVSNSGMRGREKLDPEKSPNAGLNFSSDSANFIKMNGPEIFNFTLQVVAKAVFDLLQKSKKTLDDVDLFIFHQANRYMLEHLREKLGIPEEKFFIAMNNIGNTVSSSIPIALKQAAHQNKLKKGDLVMLLGFGVGYSWAGTLLYWV